MGRWMMVAVGRGEKIVAVEENFVRQNLGGGESCYVMSFGEW
jgi:hypothetical protein